eukprot:Sspe_Gene.55350::Locus_30438_Transcript_1_1_Confidence_1.000_Length_636::g.55350::m.55350/K07390/grxD, GLRX5; monothiol glutaredoxin
MMLRRCLARIPSAVAGASALRTAAPPLRRVPPTAVASLSCRTYCTVSDQERKEIMDEMRNDIKSLKVVLFMKGEPEAPRCGFSSKVVEILGLYGVPYTSFNVLAHPAVREGIKEISGWPTIPQLFVSGEFVGGCDLVLEMHKSGDLADLFEKAGIQYWNPKTGVTSTPVQGTDDS